MRLYRTLLIAAASSALVLAQDNPHRAKDEGTPSTERGTPQRDQHATSTDSSKTSTLSSQDKKFIKATADRGRREVEIAKMGLERSSNDSVKTFAQRLVDDHTKVNSQIEDLAKNKGVTLSAEDHGKHTETSSSTSSGNKPGEGASPGTERRRGGDTGRLSKLNGAEFDRAFLKLMVDNHEKSIQNFEKLTATTDSDLRNFINQTLPTLKEHRDQAKSLSQTAGNVTTSQRSKDSEPRGAPKPNR